MNDTPAESEVLDHLPATTTQAQENLPVFAGDPVAQLETAERVVKYMAEKCGGEKFIKVIDRRPYPLVEW